MTLFEFIKAYIRPNTLLRLWFEDSGGSHWMIFEDESDRDATMEWAVLDGSSWAAKYANHKVIGVTDILCYNHPDAVNIVIEKEDVDVY